MTTRARLAQLKEDGEIAKAMAVGSLLVDDARKLLALVEAVEVCTVKEARWHRAQMEFVHSPNQRTSVDEHARLQAAANIAQGEAVLSGIALRAAIAALTTDPDGRDG